MSWWIWVLIGLGIVLFLFFFRVIIAFTVMQSVEESYSVMIPKYYYNLDLTALENAMKTAQEDDQLQYHILKLTAANPDFIEALDALCAENNYVAEINQKFSDRVAEIILTPKNLLNAERNEKA